MFRKMKLSEIGEIIAGGTPKTKVDEYWNGKIPWITPKDLSSFEGRFIAKGGRNISEEGLNNSSAKLMPKGTILFTSRAPIGYIAISDNEVTTNQGFKNIVVDNKNHNIFVYYLLKNNVSYIKSLANGSTFMEISGLIMKNIELDIPSFNQQKSIAHILSTLDEKIEVNNQINKTLENMAQAIFKQWFVDFEFPNEDGAPYKSSGGEMVESGLGMIPKGWEVGTFNDLGTIIGGGTPSKAREDYFTDQGIPWVTPKDLSNNRNKYFSKGATDITEEGLKNSSAKLMPEGTVLFSSRAPIGYITISKNEITTNQGFKSIIPDERIGSEYVYQTLKANIEVIENRATGSTFKEISGGELKKINIVIPNYKLIKTYNLIIDPISKLIMSKENEIEILKETRDSLLPKLMSGEIRVPLNSEGEAS